MNFTIEQARKVAAHYQFLLGNDLERTPSRYKITHVLIAPINMTRMRAFAHSFAANGNADLALLASGFDEDEVQVLVVHHDRFGHRIFSRELDKYLTRMGMEKNFIKKAE